MCSHRTRSIVWGLQNVAKYHEHASQANSIRVYVACIRIADVSTDLVVSFNSPVWIHAQSASAEAIVPEHLHIHTNQQATQAEFMAMINSLTVADFSLFA